MYLQSFLCQLNFVISSKKDDGFIFDLFSTKTWWLALIIFLTIWMSFHFCLFVLVFNQVQIGTVFCVFSYLSLLKCCRKSVLIPSFRIFTTNHPLIVWKMHFSKKLNNEATLGLLTGSSCWRTPNCYPRVCGNLIVSSKYDSLTTFSPKGEVSWSLKHPKKISEKRWAINCSESL